MAKRKERIQNPEPFVPDGTEYAKSKISSKAPKKHQKEGDLIDSHISSKIMKEALIQLKEVEEEEDAKEQNNTKSSFNRLEELPKVVEENDDDIDDFAGFSENQSQFAEVEDINEDDEKLLEAFLSKDLGGHKTLADIIVKRIKENDVSVASENRPVPKLDNSIIDIYKGVATLLSRYTVGKIPKAFKHIPSMQHWEEVLYVTEPEKWSPNALYQATRIFASNFGAKKAERFYKLVLLPRVREDIRKNKKLHFALYQTLKKALYKPAAFFKGILFPLCESRTCTLREAVIVGSIIEKFSIPPLHSSVALLKLAGMDYCGTTSYFIKLFLEKKYALPYRVVDAVLAHFMRFVNETRMMPVIWHQSLLAFVQRYKNELQKEDKDNLMSLLEKQNHKLVTPEISRELNNSRNRGEKEDDLIMCLVDSILSGTNHLKI
ncbi:bystin [Cicer arietinum]|uniref:bystin n=1 Tax=Cicer arietinum TaxID=3827 RepID=UPI003CC6D95C